MRGARGRDMFFKGVLMAFIWQSEKWPEISGGHMPGTREKLSLAWEKLSKLRHQAIGAGNVAIETSASQAIENIDAPAALCALCAIPGFNPGAFRALALKEKHFLRDVDPDDPEPLRAVVLDVVHAGETFRLGLEKALVVWHSHLMRFGHNNEGVIGGEYRKCPVGVYGNGRLIYLAPPPERVHDEMKAFAAFVDAVPWDSLSIPEIFRVAAVAHFRMAAIHPYGDGNGRSARLIDLACLARLPGAGKFPAFSMADAIFSNLYGYYRALQKVQGRTDCDISDFVEWHGQRAIFAMEKAISTIRDQA